MMIAIPTNEVSSSSSSYLSELEWERERECIYMSVRVVRASVVDKYIYKEIRTPPERMFLLCAVVDSWWINNIENEEVIHKRKERHRGELYENRQQTLPFSLSLSFGIERPKENYTTHIDRLLYTNIIFIHLFIIYIPFNEQDLLTYVLRNSSLS